MSNRNFTLTLNFREANAAAEQAFRESALLLGNEFAKAITAPSWQWPVAPSPRDIVDTGQLRSSQRTDTSKPFVARYEWNTAYALYVHEGYTLRNGSRMPGRPWTKQALKQFDVKRTVQTLYRQYSS